MKTFNAKSEFETHSTIQATVNGDTTDFVVLAQDDAAVYGVLPEFYPDSVEYLKTVEPEDIIEQEFDLKHDDAVIFFQRTDQNEHGFETVFGDSVEVTAK